MKRIFSAAVIAAMALTAAACGTATPSGTSQQTSQPAAPQTPTSSPSSSTPQSTAPLYPQWGEEHGALVKSGNGADAIVSAVSETSTTQPADIEFGSKPAHGYFVIITVRAENYPSATGSFDISTFDFYVRVNGEHVDEGNGNAYDAVGDVSEELSYVTLNPGEHTVGKLLFDVSSPHGTLVYAPNYTGEPIAEWKY